MRVDLDKIFDKDVSDTINLQFYVLLPEQSPPKSVLGKNSYVNFCKLAQITKKGIILGKVCLPLT